MSLHVLFFLAIYTSGIILAFTKDPFYGLLAYIFEYYHHPPLHWWGSDLPYVRWSLIIASLTFVAYLIRFAKFRHSFLKPAQTKWLILFFVVIIFVTLSTAISPEFSQKRTFQVVKLIFLYFLIIKLVRTKRQYQLFIWVHLLCVFHWGWIGYRDPSMDAGRLTSVRGPDGGNTLLGPLLASTLPFLGYYFLTGERWEKLLSILISPFILNLLILMNSRGATVGMAAAVVALVILSSGKIRFKVILAMILAGILLSNLADDRFINRQLEMRNYEEDGSAMGRIEAWKGCLRMMEDYPFGVGGEGFDILSPVYAAEARGGQAIAAHNTFLLVGAEWGWLGLFFFCTFLGSTFLELHRMRRSPRSAGFAYASGNDRESRLYIESLSIEVALIGYLTAAFFVNRIYGEALYWYCGLVGALRNGALLAQKPETSKVNITVLQAFVSFVRDYWIVFTILSPFLVLIIGFGLLGILDTVLIRMFGFLFLIVLIVSILIVRFRRQKLQRLD